MLATDFLFFLIGKVVDTKTTSTTSSKFSIEGEQFAYNECGTFFFGL